MLIFTLLDRGYDDFLRVGYNIMKNKMKMIYCVSKSFHKAYRRDIWNDPSI